MPQLDKVTFLSITFSLLVLYIVQYLLLTATHWYKFASSMKLIIKRTIYVFFQYKLNTYFLSRILFLPWIYAVHE